MPRLNALEQAYAGGFRDIIVTTAASRTFCRAILGCDLDESLHRITQIAEHARPLGLSVRVRVSTVIDCPF